MMSTLEATKCVEGLDVMKDWSVFRQQLRQGIETARKFGMDEDAIKHAAVKVGDFLNEKICPGTSEEAVLKDMWDVSNSEERKVIASVLYKMITK
jgi:hypothetical protein